MKFQITLTEHKCKEVCRGAKVGRNNKLRSVYAKLILKKRITEHLGVFNFRSLRSQY